MLRYFFFLEKVPETLSDEILGKMHAPPKADHPIATPKTLTEYDGIAFGFPTRYGVSILLLCPLPVTVLCH